MTLPDRFKARAYHKPTGQMFEADIMDKPILIGYDNVYVYLNSKRLLFSQREKLKEYNTLAYLILIPLSECILMQCTGVLDKNGQLIYEGDIIHKLHCTFGDDMYETIQWTAGGFHIESNPIMIFNQSWGSMWTIAGNVHQNPELLEVKR